MIYSPSLVSSGLSKFVALHIHDDYSKRFLDYVLFRPLLADEDDSLIVCSREVMHGLDDSLHLIANGHTEVNERLERVAKLLDPVLKFTVIRHEYKQGKATCIRLQESPALACALEEDREALLKGCPVVSILTGKARSRRELQAAREGYFRMGREAIEQTPADHPMHDLLKRLNSRPRNAFTPIEKNIEAARAAALRLPRKKAERNLRVLNAMVHPQVLYQGTANSPRLYTVNGGAQSLSEEVRTALFKGAISFDLEAAQLAVIARVWELNDVQEVLLQGRAWDVILAPFRETPHVTKKSLKSILYPLIFGMSKKELNKICENLLGMDLAKLCKVSPILMGIVNGRKDRRDRIKAENGIVDAFGIRHEFNQRGYSKDYANNLRALMAYEAQSYEAVLMRPAIEIALNNPKQCSLQLLIHDGIYVKFKSAEAEAKISRRIQLAVNAEATKHCIITRLVAK